jgi:hypothetical protein
VGLPSDNARLPKVARTPNRNLLSHLASYRPQVSRIALTLQEVILDEAPEAIDSISKCYVVASGFSFTGKPLKDGFCHIAAYSHVTLGLHRGALLPDPNKVLAGTGKMIRHVAIRDESDLERPFLKKAPAGSHRTSAEDPPESHTHPEPQSPFPPSPAATPAHSTKPTRDTTTSGSPPNEPPKADPTQKYRTNPPPAPIPHISKPLHRHKSKRRTHLDPTPHPARMKVIHSLGGKP